MRLLELKNKSKVVVVYGGGFQPFHQGHMSSYLQAKQTFPGADFYVAASNDTKTRPIPFDAKQFLAQQAGVVDPFVQVSQPINPREILANFNPEQDILVLVRSERDPMSYTKKDGTPGYYQPFVSVDQCEPFSKHGYILVTKKHVFDVNGEEVYSGSQVRSMYAEADDAGKANIIKQLYPKARDQKRIKQVFDQYLSQPGVAEGSLNEFAPGNGGGDDGQEDMLLKFARMWYNGDLHTQQQVEQTLTRAGWEIGELESEEGGAFVVQSGDEHGDSYIGFAPEDLTEGVTEGYGKYWCSTDKRWKQRQGPKQTRTTEEFEAQFDIIEEWVEQLAEQHGVDAEVIWEDFEVVNDHELLDEAAAWQKKSGKNKNGGLNAKGVASYRREHPGSKLQTAVTTKPSKLKKGSKAAKRRKSFCARMGGMKGPMKKDNGEPTRKALALRKWNC
jgi:hypothetical protein